MCKCHVCQQTVLDNQKITMSRHVLTSILPFLLLACYCSTISYRKLLNSEQQLLLAGPVKRLKINAKELDFNKKHGVISWRALFAADDFDCIWSSRRFGKLSIISVAAYVACFNV